MMIGTSSASDYILKLQDVSRRDVGRVDDSERIRVWQTPVKRYVDLPDDVAGSVSALLDIGSLVTDTGGILSRPAIIARECRLPAMAATRKATVVFTDGQ